MPKIEKKQVIVQEIKEKLTKASSIVLVNARGLTVEQDTVLRRKLRDEGVDYKVYKNTMINFAVQGTDFAQISEHLEGPTTLAICYEDPTAAARIISGEKKAMPVLEFKAAVIENTLYDAAGVTAIANIPSREVLLGRLLGSIKSPIASFARVVKAIADELENPSEAAPAEVEAAPAEEVVEVVAEAAAEEVATENQEDNKEEN
ncbi:MAG: 50S ribosomal protein L10 [Clostridiales bacterium]|jgi:large subunit ribosomal protein L10|nr:50S ribosomal protein L10 [Clostridiales bacterium]